jgi:predicted Zn-dependent peptidase
LNIVAGTLDRNVEKLLNTVTLELRKTKTELNTSRTEEVKHKMIGMMTLRSENTEARMMQLGVSALRDGKPKTFSEMIHGIGGVKRDQIEELAERLLCTDKVALTTLGLSNDTKKKLDVSY